MKPDKDRMLTRPGQLQSGLHVKSKDSRKADASLSRWWISTSRFRCWKIKSQKRSSVASLGFKPSELSKQTIFLAKTAIVHVIHEKYESRFGIFMDIMRMLRNLALHPTYTPEDSGGSSKSHPNHTDTGSGSCRGGTGSTKTCGGDGDATEGATGEGAMRAGWLQLRSVRHFWQKQTIISPSKRNQTLGSRDFAKLMSTSLTDG